MNIMSYRRCIIWLFALIFMSLMSSSLAKSPFNFNNLKCQDHDIEFSHFEKCKLNVLRRGVKSLNIRVDLYKSPVTNSTVNLAFFNRNNGNAYQPFLFNVTVDICDFFANRKRYRVLKVLTDISLQQSNLNHTCPYQDNIEVKDLVLEENQFKLFPIPVGDYLLQIKVFAYNDLKATVQVFFSRKN